MRPYYELRLAVRRVTGDPSWLHGRVHVQVLGDRMALRHDGLAGPGRIALPRQGGPLLVVAHELAHVATYSERHVDHGPGWRAEYERIADLMSTWRIGCPT